jgi:hypothetical protein
VSDPDRQIAAPEGDTPTPAPESEMELAPYRETAQADLRQPPSATDLLSFLHEHLQTLQEFIQTVPAVQPLR